MYAGRIVETGTRDQLFGAASHPYTRALLAATGADRRAGADAPAEPAGDDPLAELDPSVGCAFRARCPRAQGICALQQPDLLERGTGHPVACHFPEPQPLDASHAVTAWPPSG
jgi:peptide/nickel transport system ATP-binding protein/oligopeptide transport system ATP-binding protein